jgi:Fe-S oxidoreductase
VSCKACASECPSNVDVAALKSEFYTNTKEWFSLRNKIFANNAKLNKLGSIFPALTNYGQSTSGKKRDGRSFKREVPLLAPKHFENGLKLTNQNRNYFICKREGSAIL